MAKRGRRPKAEGEATKKVESAPVAEVKKPETVVEDKKEPEVTLGLFQPEEVKKPEEPAVSEPVSITVPTAEQVIAEDASLKQPEPFIKELPKDIEKKEETSESFVRDLPKIDPVKVPVTESKPVVEKKPEYKKPLYTGKPIEYPPSAADIVSRLKKNPVYARLTDQALLRIASAKLRSRYFFGRS